jgi:hypothetical protein
LVVSPRSNTERNVVPDSDSSVDNAKSVYDERDTSTEAYSEASSRNCREGAFPSTTTTGSGLDWSYIGTVDEENTKEHDDIEQQEEDQSKSESKSSGQRPSTSPSPRSDTLFKNTGYSRW